MSQGGQRRKGCHTGQSHGDCQTWGLKAETYWQDARDSQGHMCSMARDPRKKAEPDPVVAATAVAAAVAAVASSVMRRPSKLTENGRKSPLPTDICWRCGKLLTSERSTMQSYRGSLQRLWNKRHYEKVCLKKSTHLVDVPDSSSNSDPDYFNEYGEPVYVQTHMVHAKEINKKKHLIQFLISVNLEKVRKPAEGPCPTVLLKADMGADVCLLNLTTFDRIIGNRSILQPSTLKMEAYGNSTVAALGKFYTFLRWKGKIDRQLFFVTTANASPNLRLRDGCYTLGVLKLCYSVETPKSSSRQPTTNLEQHQMHGKSFLHWSDEGTGEEKLSNSTQWSLYKDQLQGIPLKKQDILRVYSVVSTEIRKSPDTPSKFQLQPNEEPTQHAPRQVPTHTQEQPREPVYWETSWGDWASNQSWDSGWGGSQLISRPQLVKVPDEFNTETEDHSPQEKMTGRLDSFLDGFLDGFGIVDAVPADLNTEQDPHDWKGPFPGLTRAHNN